MSDSIYLGLKTRQLEDSPEYQPINCVRLTIGGKGADGNPIVCEAGNPQSGRIIETSNPLIWDKAIGNAVAQNILTAIQGYKYKPYQADGAIINPAVEIGDAVEVGDVYSVIADIETNFSPLMPANIAAPQGSDIDHEYPFVSKENREIQRALTENATALIIQEGYISTIVSEIGTVDTQEGTIIDRLSSVEQTAAGVNLYIEKKEGSLYEAIAGQAGKIANDEVTSWAKVNITADKLSSTLGKTYTTPTEVKNSVDTALTDAKKYTDDEIESITKSYQSEITQESNKIQLSVAAAESKWDLDELKKTWNVTISKFGFTAPDNTNSSSNPLRPSSLKNKYYLDQATGFIYKSTSNGSTYTWVKQDKMSSDATDKTKALHLITANLSSRIKITEESITSTVTSKDLKTLKTDIIQTAKEIRMSASPAVNGNGELTGGTVFSLTGFETTLQTEVFNVAVDVANIHGTIKATALEAESYIQSPRISGGSISAASINSANITGGKIYSAQLYAPVIYASDYDPWSTWFSIGSSNSGYGLQLGNTYGNIFRIYNSGTSNTITFGGCNPAYDFMSVSRSGVFPLGVWDFRGCTKVYLPGGTSYP